MATEIEILGCKAKIVRVSSQVRDGLHRKGDKLVVWLSFDKPVVVVSSFAVLLPVKKYKRDEFLDNVLRLGCEELKRIVAKHDEVKREREGEYEEPRKVAVDAMAAEAQSLIE